MTSLWNLKSGPPVLTCRVHRFFAPGILETVLACRVHRILPPRTRIWKLESVLVCGVHQEAKTVFRGPGSLKSGTCTGVQGPPNCAPGIWKLESVLVCVLSLGLWKLESGICTGVHQSLHWTLGNWFCGDLSVNWVSGFWILI